MIFSLSRILLIYIWVFVCFFFLLSSIPYLYAILWWNFAYFIVLYPRQWFFALFSHFCCWAWSLSFNLVIVFLSSQIYIQFFIYSFSLLRLSIFLFVSSMFVIDHCGILQWLLKKLCQVILTSLSYLPWHLLIFQKTQFDLPGYDQDTCVFIETWTFHVLHYNTLDLLKASVLARLKITALQGKV